jgi:KTSC domain
MTRPKSYNSAELDSSAIASASYKGGTLTINFRDGSTYEYESSLAEFRQLIGSDSVGEFFNEEIR